MERHYKEVQNSNMAKAPEDSREQSHNMATAPEDSREQSHNMATAQEDSREQSHNMATAQEDSREQSHNMATAPEDSREQRQNIPRQQQWRGGVVRRKVINDRVGKTTSDIQGNRSKEQAATTSKLPGCQRKEGGGTLLQLREELADAQGKLSAYETRLEGTNRRGRDLVKENMDLQKEVDGLRDELRESEDRSPLSLHNQSSCSSDIIRSVAFCHQGDGEQLFAAVAAAEASAFALSCSPLIARRAMQLITLPNDFDQSVPPVYSIEFILRLARFTDRERSRDASTEHDTCL
ncbi:hypothetical protein AAFF_G00158980 [Aldrovandia affinis]|uniref:Uncharacterized protein n=1 Tax=Aldrovandia affinis TaxID=143900 RepID=A0AAD7RNE2_9TELE|nr:hypothetical protein AAFF_G00158980 [Aldrovandia affinis]